MQMVNAETAAVDMVAHMLVYRPFLFVGPVGVGKTQSSYAAARAMSARLGAPFAVIDKRASQMDATDISLPMPDASTGRIINYVPDWLPRVERDGEFGLLLFDEYTDAPISVQAALNQLVLERTLPGGYRLPDGWRIGATGNRSIDRAASGKVSRASANRFAIMGAVVDAKAWVAWATRNGIAPILVAFVSAAIAQGKGDEMIHKYPQGNSSDAEAFVTPRSIAAFSAYLDPALGLSRDEIRRHASYNCGDEWALAFSTFASSYALLPDINAILANPLTAPLHNDASVNYILAVTLAGKMEPSNVKTIAAYAARMGAEYASALWSTATSRTDVMIGSEAIGAVLRDTREHVAHMVEMRNAGM